jgi:hypothetical protein
VLDQPSVFLLLDLMHPRLDLLDLASRFRDVVEAEQLHRAESASHRADSSRELRHQPDQRQKRRHHRSQTTERGAHSADSAHAAAERSSAAPKNIHIPTGPLRVTRERRHQRPAAREITLHLSRRAANHRDIVPRPLVALREITRHLRLSLTTKQHLRTHRVLLSTRPPPRLLLTRLRRRRTRLLGRRRRRRRRRLVTLSTRQTINRLSQTPSTRSRRSRIPVEDDANACFAHGTTLRPCLCASRCCALNASIRRLCTSRCHARNSRIPIPLGPRQ